jgi:hypothetical protein
MIVKSMALILISFVALPPAMAAKPSPHRFKAMGLAARIALTGIVSHASYEATRPPTERERLAVPLAEIGTGSLGPREEVARLRTAIRDLEIPMSQSGAETMGLGFLRVLGESSRLESLNGNDRAELERILRDMATALRHEAKRPEWTVPVQVDVQEIDQELSSLRLEADSLGREAAELHEELKEARGLRKKVRINQGEEPMSTDTKEGRRAQDLRFDASMNGGHSDWLAKLDAQIRAVKRDESDNARNRRGNFIDLTWAKARRMALTRGGRLQASVGELRAGHPRQRLQAASDALMNWSLEHATALDMRFGELPGGESSADIQTGDWHERVPDSMTH